MSLLLTPQPHEYLHSGHLPIWAMSFDPGLTTGVAAFAEPGQRIWWGEVKDAPTLKEADMRSTVSFLAKIKPKPQLAVCENFIVDPKAKLGGQRVIASEVIGVIRTWCILNGIPLVMSLSANLDTGCKLAGITMPTDHKKTHVPSAVAHGTWYLSTIGKLSLPDGLKLRQRGP